MLRFTLSRLRGADTAGIVVMSALIVCASSLIAGSFALVFLRAYPFEDSDSLVIVWESDRQLNVERLAMTEHALPIYRERLADVVSLASFFPPRSSLSGKMAANGAPLDIAGASPALFDVLRVRPSHGRPFLAPDAALGAEPVAMLSEHLWRAEFGGDPAVVGSLFDVFWLGSRQTFRAVGVMPADFAFPHPLYPDTPDLWVAIQEVGGERFLPGHNFYVVGRLQEGATAPVVQARLTAVAAEIAREHPAVYGSISPSVVPLRAESLRDVGWVAGAFAAAFLMVLGIGVTNILYLLFVRNNSRRSELATRVALGASRRSLASLLAVDAAILAVLGAGGGVVLARLASPTLLGLLPSAMFVPSTAESFGPAVLALSSVAVVAAVVGMALLTARRATPAEGAAFGSWLDAVPGTFVGSRVINRAGSAAVFWQVGTACALATLTLGLAHQVDNFLARGERLQPASLLAMDIRFDNDVTSFDTSALERLATNLEESGIVRDVALIDRYPYTELLSEIEMEIGPDRREVRPATLHVVTRGTQDVLQAAVLEGRWFDESDNPNGKRVAIVNDAFAARYQVDGRVIGKRIRTPWGDDPSSPIEIVGVIRDDTRLQQESVPAVYLPWEQSPTRNVTLVARTDENVRRAMAPVRDQVLALAPGKVRIARTKTGTEVLAEEAAPVKLMGSQFGALALTALMLAFGGVYGIVAYRVASRAKEFALRAAVGSTRSALVMLGLRETSRKLLAGVLAGWMVAALVAGLLPSLDPALAGVQLSAFVKAGIGVFAIGLLSAVPPLMRMTAADPAVLLRA